MLNALIVENDKVTAERLQLDMEHPRSEMTEYRFGRVDVAFSRRSAVRLASAGIDYDLIIYDLKLPLDDDGEETFEDGMAMIREVRPLQPLACGILVSGYIGDYQRAFSVGRLGAVHRVIKKPALSDLILITAHDAIREAAEYARAVRDRLTDSYQLQGRVHEAMNSLNNILAATGVVEKTCRDALDFVPARSLPIIRREVANILKFQEAAEVALRSIHPAQSVRREPCNLRRVAEWCQRHLGFQYPLREESIKLAVDPALPETLGIVEELRQIVLILLTNALQATEGTPNGKAELTIDLVEKEIVIEVEDNGPGIPKDLLNRVFEPGFSTRGGSGQGLFLARTFAWNHGGRIQFSDGTGGIGTRFTVTLPLQGVEIGD